MTQIQEDINCTHHWMIDTPNGKNGFSNGKCIKCKAEKEFNNVTEQTEYNPWQQKQESQVDITKVGS